MKLLQNVIIFFGIGLISAIEVVEQLHEADSIKTNKSVVWSSPDVVSSISTPTTSFAGSPMLAAMFLQDDTSTSTTPYYGTEPPLNRAQQELRQNHPNNINPQFKSETSQQLNNNDYLKSLHSEQYRESFPEYLKTPNHKVVFDNMVYKSMKFENDIRATQLSHERSPNYNLQTKEPYPYQYVNSFTDGYVEPAPTASAHQSTTLYGAHIYPGLNEGGKKTATTHHGDKKKGTWDKVVRLLAAFIPLGLFLAALPPNLLNINTTQSATIGRQRAEDGIFLPTTDIFERFGFDSLNNVDCENRVFCEISRMGALSDANVVQQGFWQLAHDTPDNMAEALGFREIFKAVRDDECHQFKCPEKKSEGKKREKKDGKKDVEDF